MPKQHSLVEKIFYTNRKTYSDRRGNIDYLDGAPLRRPLAMPALQRTMMLVIVIVAAVIGFLFVNSTVLSSLRESLLAEQNIQTNLAREASIETIPLMTEVAGLGDKKIVKKFEKAGYTIYNASASGDDDDLILYKLPSDVALDEATAYYAKGYGSLTASQATRILVGGWNFVVEHGDATSMVVRYADFSTGDPQVAVQNAVQKQGFDAESITDSGTDDSGNTYSLGTIEIDEKPYTWKVSALPLGDMWSISNMPEEACYVGVRITG